MSRGLLELQHAERRGIKSDCSGVSLYIQLSVSGVICLLGTGTSIEAGLMTNFSLLFGGGWECPVHSFWICPCPGQSCL